MSTSQYTFQGWAAHDNDDYKGSLKFQAFDPKPWDEDDVDGETTLTVLVSDFAISFKG
jgi:hypothetical protein